MQHNKTQSKQPTATVTMAQHNTQQEWPLTEIESATLLELLQQPQPASKALVAARLRAVSVFGNSCDVGLRADT